tara:strand:+ start:241 stop:405 length:165 start_codon:yes stop_codon:yes gene_type:complete
VYNIKQKTIKTLITTLFALVMSAPFALADGCDSYGEEVAISCAIGQAWGADARL